MDNCVTHKTLLVRWDPQLPTHHTQYNSTARYNKTSCPPLPASTRKAYISWREQPKCVYFKRANISYVKEATKCPTRFPAYIRWASKQDKPCNRLVHIVWRPEPKCVEKSVDVKWAVDCNKTFKKVDIHWVGCRPELVKRKDYHLRWLTHSDDLRCRKLIYDKCPTTNFSWKTGPANILTCKCGERSKVF